MGNQAEESSAEIFPFRVGFRAGPKASVGAALDKKEYGNGESSLQDCENHLKMKGRIEKEIISCPYLIKYSNITVFVWPHRHWQHWNFRRLSNNRNTDTVVSNYARG